MSDDEAEEWRRESDAHECDSDGPVFLAVAWRVCRKCERHLALAHFPVNVTLGSGTVLYKHTCTDCRRAQQRDRGRLHRRHARPAATAPCPICRRETRRWVLDHDHRTGRFRGWLCNGCNTALGKFADDAATLRRAAAYLEADATCAAEPDAARAAEADATRRRDERGRRGVGARRDKKWCLLDRVTPPCPLGPHPPHTHPLHHTLPPSSPNTTAGGAARPSTGRPRRRRRRMQGARRARARRGATTRATTRRGRAGWRAAAARRARGGGRARAGGGGRAGARARSRAGERARRARARGRARRQRARRRGRVLRRDEDEDQAAEDAPDGAARAEGPRPADAHPQQQARRVHARHAPPRHTRRGRRGGGEAGGGEGAGRARATRGAARFGTRDPRPPSNGPSHLGTKPSPAAP